MLVISCKLSGNPTPKTIWLFNSCRLLVSSHYTSQLCNGVASLVIYNPSKADIGTYTCVAENRVHKDEITGDIKLSGE